MKRIMKNINDLHTDQMMRFFSDANRNSDFKQRIKMEFERMTEGAEKLENHQIYDLINSLFC